MRMLFGPMTGPLTEDDLLDAYPWPEGRWVRAMMVGTLDGAAAGGDGRSGSISCADDKLVFDSVRRMADVVLVGAGTVRDEGYHAMRAKPADAERRAAEGLAPAPRLAIVTASLDLPWHSELFAESALTPLVITGQRAPAETRAAARDFCDLVELPGDDVNGHDAVLALEERGLLRIDCEGGPTLLRDLAEAEVVDEMDLTIAPRFTGTARTPETPMLSHARDFELRHLIEGEGFLMTRYVAAGR